MKGKKRVELVGVGADERVGEARLRIIYVRLSQVMKWEKNPKRHDLEGIRDSIVEHGFRDAPIYDATLAGIAGGNGRIEALIEMERIEKDNNSDSIPPGILEHADDQEWLVPIQVGIDADSVEAAESFAVDHNNLTLGGSGLSALEISFLWDDSYPDLIRELQEKRRMPISISDDDLEAIAFAQRPPELKDLLNEYPDPDEEGFYPVLRFSIHPEVKKKWDLICLAFGSETEAFDATVSSYLSSLDSEKSE